MIALDLEPHPVSNLADAMTRLAHRAAARLVERHAIEGARATPAALAALVEHARPGPIEALDDDDATAELAERLGLTRLQCDALVALAAIELQPHLRELCDRLTGAPNGWLLAELVYGDRTAELLADLSPASPLVELELVALHGGAGVMRAPIAIAPRVVTWLLGSRAIDPGLPARVLAADRPAPELARALAANLVGVLVGPEGAGKTALAAGAALALDRTAIAADARGLDATAIRSLAREARLLDAILVIENAELLWEGERDRIAALERTPATLVLASTHDAFRTVGFARPVRRIELAVPNPAARAELWRAHGAGVPGAERYRVTPGLIARAAATLADRAAPTLADVHAAVRDQLADKLSAIATRVPPSAERAELILPRDTLAGLEELVARVRHRDRVTGPGSRRGVSALFAGEPGTGKTMAAGIVAAELGLDLYQIDLSRVVSKWIGETEKNLAQVFDAAEAGHALLLFDEADSLFAKRTEVKSSVDRYANMEVNFLLMRLERFEGVAILTTNLDTSIDPAFRRRLTFRLTFPRPTVAEREQLWRRLAPAVPAAEIAALAELELSGAYIANAALRAAYLAAADDEPHVTGDYLRIAAELEYTELGKLFPGRLG